MDHFNRTVLMPVDLMRAFSKHTGLFWSSLEFEGAVCDAMAAAMEARPAQEQAHVPPDAMSAGYQWKQVFLPQGTVLRASFGRQPYYAAVEGAEIKYGQYSLSPSAFANLQGSGNRNAWKAVWLRFPGSGSWVRADECRALQQAATVRLFEQRAPGQAGQQEPKPEPPAGYHQQLYEENKPNRDHAVPYHVLLSEIASHADAAYDGETAPLPSGADGGNELKRIAVEEADTQTPQGRAKRKGRGRKSAKRRSLHGKKR